MAAVATPGCSPSDPRRQFYSPRRQGDSASTEEVASEATSPRRFDSARTGGEEHNEEEILRLVALQMNPTQQAALLQNEAVAEITTSPLAADIKPPTAQLHPTDGPTSHTQPLCNHGRAPTTPR